MHREQSCPEPKSPAEPPLAAVVVFVPLNLAVVYLERGDGLSRGPPLPP